MNSSKEKHGRTETRKNTLQKMLDLEKKNKLDRMQASSTMAVSPTMHSQMHNNFFRERIPTTQDVYYNKPPVRPAPFRQTDRAMTAPTLTVLVPPPTQNSEQLKRKGKLPQTPKEVPQPSTNIIPEADGDVSDSSSICRSPAWDGGEGKRKRMAKKAALEMRKKEEERMSREKERVEKETRAAALKQKGRLSKAQPTNKRLSKTTAATALPRTFSAPVIQQTLPDVPDTVSIETSGEGKSRRTSLDLGFKSFISSFKSSNGTRRASSSLSQSKENSPTKTGFIGGLRLQLADGTAVDNKSQPKNQLGDGADKVSRPPISLDNPRNRILDLNNSSAKKSPPAEIQNQSKSVDSYVSKSEGPGAPQLSPLESVMSRNIRARPRNANDELTLSPLTDAILNAQAKSQALIIPPSPGFRFGLEGIPAAEPERQEPPYFQNFDTSPQELGNNDVGYFDSHIKQQSQKENMYRAKNERKADASNQKKTVQRTSSIHGSRSSVQSPSPTVPRINAEMVDDSEEYDAFLDGDYTPPSLTLHPGLSQTSILPEEGLFTFRERSPPISSPLSPPILKPAPAKGSPTKGSPTFKGIKGVAMAAFSRHSYQPSASSSNGSSSNELPTEKASRPKTTLSPITKGFDSRSILPSQVRRQSQEQSYEPPKVESPVAETVVPAQKPLVRDTLNVAPVRKQGKDHRSSSRSFTGSSEEYLSFDEQSNITTPAVSRPQSQKGHVATAPSQDTTAQSHKKDSENFSRTALPIDQDDDDNTTTPTGHETPPTGRMNPHSKRSTVDPNTAEGVTDLQRRLSLSKSNSTPAFQDELNFLPTLKHQPLRPRQDKRPSSSSDTGARGRTHSANSQYHDAKDRSTSSASLLENVNGQSTTSGDGGQYLQNARQMLGPRSPKGKGRFPMDPTSSRSSLQSESNSMNGQPMAKMFVICCGCRYFHDMPSKLYECMARPDGVIKDEGLGVSGLISTAVKCPWCGHGMTTRCCEGWAAVVSLRERLH